MTREGVTKRKQLDLGESTKQQLIQRPTLPLDLRPLQKHSWLGCGSCPTPGDCHLDCKGPSECLAPDAYRTASWAEDQLAKSTQGLKRLQPLPPLLMHLPVDTNSGPWVGSGES